MCLHPELSLLTYFQILPDPRVARTREHRLIDLLVIAVCTLLCGGEGFNEMEDFGWAKEEWLKSFLELPGGIPSHDAFNRLFQSLDPHSFLECFLRWTQSLRVAVAEEIVALDGKALRRALQAGGTAPVLVSAWAAGEWAGSGPDQGAVQEQRDSRPCPNCCGPWNWPAASSRWMRWAVRRTSPKRSKKPTRMAEARCNPHWDQLWQPA